MKQSLPLLRRHRIRRLQREVVHFQREQKVRERRRRLPPFLRAQLRQDIRHRGAGLGPMRIGDERLQPYRIGTRADVGKSRCLLRSSRQRRIARVASRAIQLLDQHHSLQFRIELAGSHSGNNHLRKYGRNGTEVEHDAKCDPRENPRHPEP